MFYVSFCIRKSCKCRLPARRRDCPHGSTRSVPPDRRSSDLIAVGPVLTARHLRSKSMGFSGLLCGPRSRCYHDRNGTSSALHAFPRPAYLYSCRCAVRPADFHRCRLARHRPFPAGLPIVSRTHRGSDPCGRSGYGSTDSTCFLHGPRPHVTVACIHFGRVDCSAWISTRNAFPLRFAHCCGRGPCACPLGVGCKRLFYCARVDILSDSGNGFRSPNCPRRCRDLLPIGSRRNHLTLRHGSATKPWTIGGKHTFP